MNNLYRCDDCHLTACLWVMNKRSHGGYDCHLCGGEVSLVFVVGFQGCLNILGKEKLENGEQEDRCREDRSV